VAVCPECKALAILDGIELPPTGRLVSCAVCGGIWRAFPQPVQPDSPAAEQPPPAPDPSAGEVRIVAPTGARRERAAMTWVFRACLGLAAASIAAGILTAARNYLAVWIPSSRGLFTAVGLSTRPSDVAVDLIAITPLMGDTAFKVTYEIVNDTSLSRPLPTVCATGRDREAERLFLRCFGGDGQKLPSLTSKRFTFVAAELASPLSDLDLDIPSKKD
jgi:predicted Zn finger-like uncharacterized protein